MKRFSIFLISTLLLCTNSVWGGGGTTTYYAKLTASIASGSGKVYVSTTEDTPDWSKQGETSDATGSASSTGSPANVTFYAYAQAEEDYTFTGWSESEEGTSITSSDNPYSVSVAASSTDQKNPTPAKIYAVFSSNYYASVTFGNSETSTGLGSVKVALDDKAISSGAVLSGTEETFTFTATATPEGMHNTFKGWTASPTLGEIIAEDNPHTFSVTGTQFKTSPGTGSLYAVFETDGTPIFYARQTISVMHDDDPHYCNGEGLIFINTTKDSANASFAESMTLDNYAYGANTSAKNAKPQFYFYARPTAGSVFYGWYKKGTQPTAAPTTTNNPYSVQPITTTSKDPENPTIGTEYYAYFRKSTEKDDHYAKLTAEVKSDSKDMGWVCVKPSADDAPENEEYAASSTSVSYTASASYQVNVAFKEYVKAKRGYKFTGWWTSNGTKASSTNNPYFVNVASKVIDPASPTDGTSAARFAAFAENTAYMITYTKPNHGDIYVAFSGQEKDENGHPYMKDFVESTADMAAGETLTVTHYPTDNVTLTYVSTDNEGYHMSSWKNGSTTLDSHAEYTFTPKEDMTISVEEVDYSYKVAGNYYNDLNSAISAAASQTTAANKKVVVVCDATVPAGTYTIPYGVTLLVPYDENGTTNGSSAKFVSGKAYEKTSYFKILTLAEGVQLTVNGNVEVGGQLMAFSTGSADSHPGQGVMTGPMGLLKMEEGSSMTLNSGANLFAWGLVRGAGYITAENGSKVYEAIQINDWRGGSATSGMNGNKNKVFPFSQYYIQNVEAKLLFKSGAMDYVSSGVYVSSSLKSLKNVVYVGTSSAGGLFQLGSNATLLKYYDAEYDRQMCVTNGTCSINDLKFTLYISISSSSYVLPMSSNMDVTIASGTLTVNVTAISLPAGAKVTIAEGATMVVPAKHEMFVYDGDQWGKYCHDKLYTSPLRYSEPFVPTTLRDGSKPQPDAMVCVNGTLQVLGNLYTTESGANICSTADGKVIVETVKQSTIYGYVDNSTYDPQTAVPAMLKHGNGEYLSTESGFNYLYHNGYWYATIAYQGNDIPVVKNDPDDHAYRDADDADKFYIYYNNEWILVRQEEPGKYYDNKAFYTYQEKTKEWIATEIETDIVVEEQESKQYRNTQKEVSSVTINDGGTMTMDNATITSPVVTVNAGAQLTMTENSKIDGVSTLILSAEENIGSNTKAAHVDGTIELADNADVYFDWKMTPQIGHTIAETWHAFCVPFPVNAQNGLYGILPDGTVSSSPLVYNSDFAIMRYHGDIRATGKYGWKTYQGILQPGVFYLMTVENTYPIIRFRKEDNATIINQYQLDYSRYDASGEGVTSDAGWNGLGNPNMFTCQIADKVTLLDPQAYEYRTYVKTDNLHDGMGTPFFYQATHTSQMTISKVVETPASTPKQMWTNNAPLDEDEVVTYAIHLSDGNYTDNIYISASKDARSEYELGKDLLKMQMSETPTVPQLYAMAYGNKLAIMHTLLDANQAIYPIALYVPKEGIYTLSAEQTNEASIFLTQNGYIIHNLSNDYYRIALDKGTTTEYGLLLVLQAPQTPTEMRTEKSEKNINVQKLIINQNFYIIRNHKSYDGLGRSVNIR